MQTKRQRRKSHTKSQRKYDAVHTTRINLKFNNESDVDIIEYLSDRNKQGTIKAAIREYITNHRFDIIDEFKKKEA